MTDENPENGAGSTDASDDAVPGAQGDESGSSEGRNGSVVGAVTKEVDTDDMDTIDGIPVSDHYSGMIDEMSQLIDDDPEELIATHPVARRTLESITHDIYQEVCYGQPGGR